MVSLNFQTLVEYGSVLVLPILHFSLCLLYPPTKTTETVEETSTKPLEPILHPPLDDLLPPKDDPFTAEELAQYDGSDPSKPIYVAIKGDIFDVTRKNDVYGPGRSYNIFAGKDGSRGLGMSSLKAEHAVADFSTLSESEMKVLDEWHSFFSKRYNIVGKVVSSPPDLAETPSTNM